MERSGTKLLIENLPLCMRIGIHPHEKTAPQPVLANIELHIPDNAQWRNDRYEDTVCYDSIVQSVKKMAAEKHIRLVETFAEQIAEMCLKNFRVNSVRISIRKTNVYGDGTSVGVEIQRIQDA